MSKPVVANVQVDIHSLDRTSTGVIDATPSWASSVGLSAAELLTLARDALDEAIEYHLELEQRITKGERE